MNKMNSSKAEQIKKTYSEQEMLDYLISNYDQLKSEQPKYLADLIVSFTNQLLNTGMNQQFIKRWLEHALKIDPKNKPTLSSLSTYRLQEKRQLTNSLVFPPLRESDNRSQRQSTLLKYRQVCESFLLLADEELQQLQHELLLFKDNEQMKKTYDDLIEVLEKIIEEIVQLQKRLNDFDELSGRTFYNVNQVEQIQETVTTITELKNRWINYFVDPAEDQETTALQQLNEMIGLTDVKRRIENFYRYLKFQKSRKEFGLQTKDEPSLNMILLGNPGTGKTTIARLLAKIYHELGVLPSEEVIETNRSQLVGSFVGQTEENVRMIVEKALGGVLFIDEAYSLKRTGQSGNDYGQTAIDTLVSLMTSKEYGGKFSVILAGYPEEMRQFLDANTGLRSRFPQSNIIELPDYSLEELLEIGQKIARSNDFLLTTKAKKSLAYLIEQEQVDQTFGNARAVHNLIMQAIFQKGFQKQSTQPEIFFYTVLDENDFKKPAKNEQDSLSPIEKLNKLVGLKEVKDAVQTYISFVKMQTLRREHNYPSVPIQLHSVFTGNPGTGKTTVAKIYAELLKECGMLKRGHLVVVGRADLIAGYVGQSALKTKKKIQEALGGVLFIDEAYSLFRENNQDYGKEVVDTIVDEMTKHGENLVIILAGYPNEMEQLLESNPGLKSRFKKFFHFEDYSAEELIAIMKLFAKSYAYELDKDAVQLLQHELSIKKPKGNGRFAENLIHEAIQQQSLRLMKTDHTLDLACVNRLTKEDINAAFQILLKGE
ncbi:AAA family ATPase [Caldifermentibacillus hisashii]|uniref:AAA family ATPase n=1 Tax=Caldifermentibacillus hisashii TaxID=996558 RepID=UPI000BA3A199|nr:AAA family ATPase [Caldifermentibacillus hisashii]PAC37779.1 stage V sporulation protein K [Caldifermentibacillus hisashii]